MSEPYRVDVDTPGCEHCGAGKTWTVVDADDVAIGQSFSDQEDAEHIAGLMNGAFAVGYEQATEHE